MEPRCGAGVPAALEPHCLYSTDDPRSAERLGFPFLGRHHLALQEGATAGFRTTLHAALIGRVTLGYLTFAAATRVELAGSALRVLVVAPINERTLIRTGSGSFEAAPDCAVVLQPGRHVTMHCPAGMPHLVVAIEQQAVLVHLSRVLGRALDRPLVLEPQFDLGSAPASRWNLAVEMLHAELLEEGSLLRSGVGQGQLEDFVMSSLLYAQRSSYSEALWRRGRRADDAVVATAEHFVEVHLAENLTVGRVASAAGVSSRTLQAAFRAALRTTPTAYIRSARLDRVRRDLADADVPGTVTEVATRWGFTHLGRFAADYRTRFGESPSQTRRAHRGGASAS